MTEPEQPTLVENMLLMRKESGLRNCADADS